MWHKTCIKETSSNPTCRLMQETMCHKTCISRFCWWNNWCWDWSNYFLCPCPSITETKSCPSSVGSTPLGLWFPLNREWYPSRLYVSATRERNPIFVSFERNNIDRNNYMICGTSSNTWALVAREGSTEKPAGKSPETAPSLSVSIVAVPIVSGTQVQDCSEDPACN